MSHTGHRQGGDDASEVGDDLFMGEHITEDLRGSQHESEGTTQGQSGPRGAKPIERHVQQSGSRGFGRGPIKVDTRKYRYDVMRAHTLPAVSYSASKVDRLDAVDGGMVLHRIHELVGVDKLEESVILAFDKALWLEHTLNGASLLQPGRGSLRVGNTEFDISVAKGYLAEQARRFFRTFADDIAAVNREVLNAGDPWDHEAYEKAQQVMQVAIERGLQKYPHLAHDSSDACLSISVEERLAVLSSKRVVIADSVDATSENPRAGVSSTYGDRK